MYGGKNTLIRASVDRREACSLDVILSKNSFFDSQRCFSRYRRGGFFSRRQKKKLKRIILTENG